MIIGSSSPWLMLQGMIAPAARDLGAHEFRRDERDRCAKLSAVGKRGFARSSFCLRPRFSRVATYIISLVMIPARANSSWVIL